MAVVFARRRLLWGVEGSVMEGEGEDPLLGVGELMDLVRLLVDGVAELELRLRVGTPLGVLDLGMGLVFWRG